MEWKAPEEGDRRIVWRFAFLPIEADDKVRWLQLCRIKQAFVWQPYFASRRLEWVNEEFV